jgi:hypothetical protein
MSTSEEDLQNNFDAFEVCADKRTFHFFDVRSFDINK